MEKPRFKNIYVYFSYFLFINIINPASPNLTAIFELLAANVF